MRAFITKYALTDGIREVEIISNNQDGFITANYNGWQTYFSKPHWHLTENEAIDWAEHMRVKKIESLKKQISKLEKLNFSK